MTEVDKKLNRLFEVTQGILDLQPTLNDLEGDKVPYNIIRKIDYMMCAVSVELQIRTRLLHRELERMGYPKHEEIKKGSETKEQ